MTQVRYIGPHSSVDVLLDDGTRQRVGQGEKFETTAAHAKSLLEQTENWQAVKAAASSKKESDDGG